MTEKRFTTVELPKPNRWGIWYDGACLSTYQVCILLNEYVDVKKENEQLKQRCKELRNDLIDHSALINMLEKVKALNIEDMIWNTMGYKTQTEFDDDFADYREYAKKRWKE